MGKLPSLQRPQLTYLQSRYVYHLTTDGTHRGDRVAAVRQALMDKMQREVDALCRKALPIKEQRAEVERLHKRVNRYRPSGLKQQADRLEGYSSVREAIDYEYQRQERASESNPDDVIRTLENIRKADPVSILLGLTEIRTDGDGNSTMVISPEKMQLLPLEARQAMSEITFDAGKQIVKFKLVDRLAATRQLQKYHGLDHSGKGAGDGKDGFIDQVLGEISDVDNLGVEGGNPRLLTVGNVPAEDRGQLWGHEHFEKDAVEGVASGPALPPPTREPMNYEDLFDD